jgi:tetratricopeptide (TPR) repeat protein
LYYIGSYNESLEALDRTDQLLGECAISEYDGARSRLIRAQVYGEVERFDAAIALAEAARSIFRRFSDTNREAAADSTMGALLMHTRRFSQALAIQKSLAANARLDATSRAFALHNTAVCHWELSQLEEARFVFVQAISEFERLGIATMRAKARWLLGQVLVAEQRYEQALTIFGALRQEFQDLGMPHDVALVSVDEAAALLTLDRRPEVVQLCQAAIEYFAKASLAYTQGALIALAYLKEAAEARKLTPRALGDVRAYFELLPKRPELLFASPA